MAESKKYKLITLVGVVCFPQMPITCDIRREATKNSIMEAFERGEQVVFVTQTKNTLSRNVIDSINPVGCLCDVMNVEISGSVLKVQAEGLERVAVSDILQGDKFLFCTATALEETKISSTTQSLLMSTAKQNFVEYASSEKRFSPELMRALDALNEPNSFIDAVTVLSIKEEKKQLELLNEADTQKRLELLIEFLMEEIEIQKVNEELSKRVHKSMDQNQREYYLR